MNTISVNKNIDDPNTIFVISNNDTGLIDTPISFANRAFVIGPSKVIYKVDNRYAEYRIVWVETEDVIIPNIEYSSVQMKTNIHISQPSIIHNTGPGHDRPVCRIDDGDTVRYCMEVEIKGPSRLVYNPDNPLSFGGKIWIETDSDINLINEFTTVENKW